MSNFVTNTIYQTVAKNQPHKTPNHSPSSQKHSAYKFHNFQRARFARSHGEKSKARGDFFLHKIRTPPRVVQPGVGDLRRAQKDIKIHAQFRSVRVRGGRKFSSRSAARPKISLKNPPTDIKIAAEIFAFVREVRENFAQPRLFFHDFVKKV